MSKLLLDSSILSNICEERERDFRKKKEEEEKEEITDSGSKKLGKQNFVRDCTIGGKGNEEQSRLDRSRN